MEHVNYFEKLKKQYPHLQDDIIQDVIDSAKEILIHLLFPSKLIPSSSQEELAYKSHQYWILRASKDLISRNGLENVLSYKENGLSITFSQDQLSEQLIKEITPVMGTM